MKYVKSLILLKIGIILSLFSSLLYAHGLEPIFISLISTSEHNYRVELRLPDEFKEENSPYFIFPDDCEVNTFNQYISTAQCQDSLIGKELVIKFDYFVPQISTLINYYDLNGQNSLYDITANPKWTVPSIVAPETQNTKFLLVGFEHILGGFDHVLFIICLLMIVKSNKQLLKAITGFTLSHSITLLLVSVGIFQP